MKMIGTLDWKLNLRTVSEDFEFVATASFLTKTHLCVLELEINLYNSSVEFSNPIGQKLLINFI